MERPTEGIGYGYVKRFCLITSACHLPLEEPEATKQSGKEFEQGEKEQMGFPSPCWSAASQALPDLQGKEGFESDGRSFGFRLHWTFEDLKIIIFISILFLFCFKSTLKCCGDSWEIIQSWPNRTSMKVEVEISTQISDRLCKFPPSQNSKFD